LNSAFWQKDVYRYAFFSCGLFVLLTVVAMFTYPGGTFTDGTTIGYNFFRNFFSDLGRVTAPNGQSNIASLILFFTALSTAGIGLIVFFLAFRNFFKTDHIENVLSLIGTISGMATGLCFIGIAFAPYDLFFDIHYQLVIWAFRTFFVAVGIYAFVIFRQDIYPPRYGWIFAAFAIFLAAYIGLLEFGPSAETFQGLVIQATGQKIIVYVSIISAMAQSGLAYRWQENSLTEKQIATQV
jgi:hypothetical membrane protein